MLRCGRRTLCHPTALRDPASASAVFQLGRTLADSCGGGGRQAGRQPTQRTTRTRRTSTTTLSFGQVKVAGSNLAALRDGDRACSASAPRGGSAPVGRQPLASLRKRGAPELPDTRPADVPTTPVTLQPERRWLLPTPRLRCGERPGGRDSSHRTARTTASRRVRARQNGMDVSAVPGSSLRAAGVRSVPSPVGGCRSRCGRTLRP
jgi:hypothetical protein